MWWRLKFLVARFWELWFMCTSLRKTVPDCDEGGWLALWGSSFSHMVTLTCSVYNTVNWTQSCTLLATQFSHSVPANSCVQTRSFLHFTCCKMRCSWFEHGLNVTLCWLSKPCSGGLSWGFFYYWIIKHRSMVCCHWSLAVAYVACTQAHQHLSSWTTEQLDTIEFLFSISVALFVFRRCSPTYKRISSSESLQNNALSTKKERISLNIIE